MTEIKEFFRSLMTAVLRVLLWLITALVAVVLLALALLLLLIGMLWALVRGKKPEAPVFVGRFQRYAAERVWPAGARKPEAQNPRDVVDVQVREVEHPRSPDEADQSPKKD